VGDAFTIQARDPASAARAGLLHTAHGDVRTPAFVPLATKATVKGLLPEEVAQLGYDMVLGNTFHLHLRPGEELIQRLGGLHEFMGWSGPIITDSGGFQVFSMGHGTVADEIKGRASPRAPQGGGGAEGRPDGAKDGKGGQGAAKGGQGGARGGQGGAKGGQGGGGGGQGAGGQAGAKGGQGGGGGKAGAHEHAGAIVAIQEDGVRFRSYLDGRLRFLSPEKSMAIQAALGSDIALVFDECTPFHVQRSYTEHSTLRTHRWLDRCLAWHQANGPPGQLIYGIVQGGVFEDLRRASAQYVANSRCQGIAIGGSLGEDKAQMYEVIAWALHELGGEHQARPRHLLGIGEVDDLIRGVELGIDTFDCAMPTRLGRHGCALVPDPAARWRLDLHRSRYRDDPRPLLQGCECYACARGLSRAYLSYLARARELTGMRLLTLHNLAFIARLMRELRQGILDGRLAEVAAAWRLGASH
jgi:queuine tRNA-ribosyltransferase